MPVDTRVKMLDLSSISPKFTEATLLKVIEKIRPGSHVSSWHIEMCGTRGTSYQSELFRLTITGALLEDTFVVNAFVKALPRNRARRLTFRSPEFYSREIEFSDKIWPAFVDLQERFNVSAPYDEVPRTLATYEDGENDFIVMEDLSAVGYRSADRQVEIDLAHCKLALTSFGKLHGLSHAMRVLEPEQFKQLTSHMTDIYYATDTRAWHEPMVQLEINVAKDAVAKEYPGTQLESKFNEWTSNVHEFYSEMAKLSHTTNEYAVIGHGDCWPPNFMYQYEKDQALQPQDMKIIDFQLVRLGSCALDISFFVYSCTTEELRQDHYEEMLQWYYEGVAHTLTQFNLDADKVFPRTLLDEEMRQFARFGVGAAMEAIPVSLLADEDTTDMDAIEGITPLTLPEVWNLKPIVDQEGRRRLANIFKHSFEQGYLQ